MGKTDYKKILHKQAVVSVESAINLLKAEEDNNMWRKGAIRLLEEGLDLYKRYLMERGIKID